VWKIAIRPPLAGAAGGALLAAGMLWPALAPLQGVAFVPLLWLLSGPPRYRGVGGVLLAGLCMGVALSFPQIVAYRMLSRIGLMLVAYFTALMVALVVLARLSARRGALASAMAFTAALVVVDWCTITILPVWGTAQSLTRPWSAYPGLIQFVRYTGLTGILVFLGGVQALAVTFCMRPAARGRCAVAAVVLVAAFAGANYFAGRDRPAGSLKVAAIGWLKDTATPTDLGIADVKRFEQLYARPAAEAAKQGAKLIVSPELGFRFEDRDQRVWMDRFAAVAKKHDAHLVVAYFNMTHQKNGVFVMAPTGEVLADYHKTHLTPREHYPRGTGEIVTADIGGVRLGVMICQDDNYTDLSRAHGRRRVAVMAVPTSDWEAIRRPHFQSGIHRAIESRYAIVRAARNGLSAVITPRGEVLAHRDHVRTGPGVVVAEVPLAPGRTLFSRLGHWPAGVAAAFLAIFWGWALRARCTKQRLPR